jgi:hypothetical protein
MKRVIVFLICFSLLIPSVSLFAAETAGAGQSAVDKLCGAAKKDAIKDMTQNSFMWNALGCIVGPLALAGAYFLPPSVPATRVTGKSSKYVQVYSSCYQEQGKSEQFNHAMLGCGIAAGVEVVALIIYFVFVANVMNQVATSTI